MIFKTGLGLRAPYVQALLEKKPSSINWLEFLADQYFNAPDFLLKKLDQIREIYPCVLHSVNLSIASTERLSSRYLKFLEGLVARYEPAWISDHLCLSRFGKLYTHDLLPFVLTHKKLDQIARRIDYLQTRFKKPFLIENISSYLRFENKNNNNFNFSEGQFLQKLISKTGCGLLLDINNLILSALNHGESIEEFLQEINLNSIKQIHLAGGEYHQGLWIDTHSREISQKSWEVFSKIQASHGRSSPIPACLEWDNDLPSFEKILQETQKIEAVFSESFLLKENNFYQPPVPIPLSKKIKQSENILDAESAWVLALQGQPEDLYKIMDTNNNPEARLEVYLSSIKGTRVKVLEKTFRSLRKILGDEIFEACINKYAEIKISESFNLNLYGEGFGDFLESFLEIENALTLKDLADYCYAWRQVYSQGDIQGMQVSFKTPAYEIWKQCQPEYKGPVVMPEKFGNFEYLLYRDENKVRVFEINQIDKKFLSCYKNDAILQM